MKQATPIGVIICAVALGAMLLIPFVIPHTPSGATQESAEMAPAGAPAGAPSKSAGGVEAAGDERTHDHEAPDTDPHWYVTMHGEGTLAQVYAIDGAGRMLGPVLGPLPAGQSALDEVRGLVVLGDNRLAVVNAKSTASRVLLFGPVDSRTGIRPYDGVWTQEGEGNTALVHPYQILVGPDGNLYAGNQDTNTITRYYGLGSAKRGQPMPVAEGLAAFGSLPPGTVIPNSQQSPEGIGLVRGFTFGPDGKLYVCDRGRSRVAVYDPDTGRYLRSIMTAQQGLKHPIQLLFSANGETAFISDNDANCVWQVQLSTGHATALVKPGAGGLKAASALAIRDRILYVGSRIGKAILKFNLRTGAPQGSFADLPSNPEFFIPISQQ